MKLLIVSDTHGSIEGFRAALEAEAPVDEVIHLGDFSVYQSEIRRLPGCPVDIVRGNNDRDYTVPDEMTLWFGKCRMFLCHGHSYGCGFTLRKLQAAAYSRKANAVLYGHTHYPEITEKDGITYVNPGSLTLPRQPDCRRSYAVMTLDSEGEAHFELKYLD